MVNSEKKLLFSPFAAPCGFFISVAAHGWFSDKPYIIIKPVKPEKNKANIFAFL